MTQPFDGLPCPGEGAVTCTRRAPIKEQGINPIFTCDATIAPNRKSA